VSKLEKVDSRGRFLRAAALRFSVAARMLESRWAGSRAAAPVAVTSALVHAFVVNDEARCPEPPPRTARKRADPRDAAGVPRAGAPDERAQRACEGLVRSRLAARVGSGSYSYSYS